MINDELISLSKEIKIKCLNNFTISVAESCTGGLLSECLTAIPGSSKYFELGIVSYSNNAKIKLLNVALETIEHYGAVSEEVAKEMAIGSRDKAKSNLAISITGIAGPEGGSIKKPVGTVCFGINTAVKAETFTYYFSGDREKVRYAACKKALQLILDNLMITKDI